MLLRSTVITEPLLKIEQETAKRWISIKMIDAFVEFKPENAILIFKNLTAYYIIIYVFILNVCF